MTETAQRCAERAARGNLPQDMPDSGRSTA